VSRKHAEPPAKARCLALAGEAWATPHLDEVESDGRHLVRVLATVPPMRGTTVVVQATANTRGRAWAKAWRLLRKRVEAWAHQLMADSRNLDLQSSRCRGEAATLFHLLGDDAARRP
jgi:hypothetical protein